MFNFMKGVCLSIFNDRQKKQETIPEHNYFESEMESAIQRGNRKQELLDRFAMQAMLLEHNGFTPFDSPEKRKAKSLNCYAIAESMMEARIKHHERSEDKA